MQDTSDKVKVGQVNAGQVKAGQLMAAVLAGGEGRRMGYVHKPLIEVGGKSVMRHIMTRLAPQVGKIIINTNASSALYNAFDAEVVPDLMDVKLGPLLGVLTAMDWAAMNMTATTHILTLPGDAPFIPRDLADEMLAALNTAIHHAEGDSAPILARASSMGRTHPVIGIWPITLRAELRDQLINNDVRKIDRFTADYKVVDVSFDGVPDPFFNINTAEDAAMADRILTDKPATI